MVHPQVPHLHVKTELIILTEVVYAGIYENKVGFDCLEMKWVSSLFLSGHLGIDVLGIVHHSMRDGLHDLISGLISNNIKPSPFPILP